MVEIRRPRKQNEGGDQLLRKVLPQRQHVLTKVLKHKWRRFFGVECAKLVRKDYFGNSQGKVYEVTSVDHLFSWQPKARGCAPSNDGFIQ